MHQSVKVLQSQSQAISRHRLLVERKVFLDIYFSYNVLIEILRTFKMCHFKSMLFTDSKEPQLLIKDLNQPE